MKRLLAGALTLSLIAQSFPAWTEGQTITQARSGGSAARGFFPAGTAFFRVAHVSLGALRLGSLQSGFPGLQTTGLAANSIQQTVLPSQAAVLSAQVLPTAVAVPGRVPISPGDSTVHSFVNSSPYSQTGLARVQQASGQRREAKTLNLAQDMSRLGPQLKSMSAAQAYESLRRIVDGAGSTSVDALVAQAPVYAASRSGAVLSRFVESVDSLEVEWADHEGAAESAAEAAKQQPGHRGAASEQKIYKTYRWARRLFFLPVHMRYKVRVMGELPKGPALFVLDHPSYLDPFLVSFMLRRPVRFFMFRDFAEGNIKLRTKKWYLKPLFGLANFSLKPFAMLARWFFWAVGVIPLSQGDSRTRLQESFFEGRRALKNGELVGIFPTGEVTRTGNYFQKYKHGFEKVAEDLPISVIPVAIEGLWGSIFSYQGSFFSKLFKALKALLLGRRRLVVLNFGKPLPPEKINVQAARETVQELGAEAMTERLRATTHTLPRDFLRRAKKSWFRPAIADTTGKLMTYGKTLAASVLFSILFRPLLPAAPNVGVLVPPTFGAAATNIALSILGKASVNLNYSADAEAVKYAVQKTKSKKIITSRKAIAGFAERDLKFDEQFAKEHFIYLEDFLPHGPWWKIPFTAFLWKFIGLYFFLMVSPRFLSEALFFRDASRSLDDVATILFTTGSTGTPKGVKLTHLNIQHQAQVLTELLPLPKKGSLLGILPFFHAFGYAITLWLVLLKGYMAAYHTHPKETGPIAKLALKHRANALMATPAFIKRFTEMIPVAAFAFVKLVITGAEKLWPSIREAFKKKFGVDILEGYGVTETSPVISVNLPDYIGKDGKVKQVGNKLGTVGQPIPGVAVRVVNPDTGESVPDGQEGVLLVKGPLVMAGYLDEPEETDKVLKDGWYNTGDIVTIDRDGFITIVDRLSSYAKIEGEKVSPMKVQEKLHEAARLKDQVFVVTVVQDEKLGGERLVVLYERFHPGIPRSDFEDDGSLSQNIIHEILEEARRLGLRGAWMPRQDSFFAVDQIPLAGSGKADMPKVKELARQLIR